MKELFEQNKVLFLAVITALIIVFLVKKLIDYITRKGLEGIRLDVYKLFVEAEKTFRASKQGQQKLISSSWCFRCTHTYGYAIWWNCFR